MEEYKEVTNTEDIKEDARQEEDMDESRKLKIESSPTLHTQEEGAPGHPLADEGLVRTLREGGSSVIPS